MRLLSTLLTLPVLVVVFAACPKPLAGGDPVVWTKVEGAPATRSLFDDVQREQADVYKQRAHVNKMRAAFVQADEGLCKTDDECVLTPMHCCTCAAGGKTAAAHKDKLPTVLRRRGQACEDYTCAQVVSSDPTCEATRAVCRAGKCVPDVPEGSQGAQAVGGTEKIEPEGDKGEGAP
jgi:hypothetical protein